MELAMTRDGNYQNWELFYEKKTTSDFNKSWRHFKVLLSDGLHQSKWQLIILHLDELIVEELYYKEIQKSARILRNSQQVVADNVSKELFKTGDDKIN